MKANTFCLHGDIRKYFPSINHSVLKVLLRRHVADQQVLSVLDKIIDSSGETGLPIGNLTSQFFANLYLNELDRFVKHELKEKYYIRYMDDFLIFGKDRAKLNVVRQEVSAFLKEQLHLTLHESKSQVFTCRQGLTFLGFRLFDNNRRLAASNVKRVYQRVTGRKKQDDFDQQHTSIMIDIGPHDLSV